MDLSTQYQNLTCSLVICRVLETQILDLLL